MPRALMTYTAEDSRSLRVFAPVLVLLVLAFLINYIDRGNISVAGPLIKSEFQLSDSELGVLFAAFFCTYTAMQFLIGWLVDRFNPATILAAGFLVWSLATAATGLVRGFGLLLAVRFILGVGESVAMPTGSKILAQHLPEHYRGFASGALMSALRVGNAVGTLGAGLLMAKYGWRPVFIIIGVASLAWLPLWARWKPGDPMVRSHVGEEHRARLIDIVMHRSFWGTSAGHFASNYLFYFMITWLPSYLVRERHLSMETMSEIAGLYYSVDAVGAIAGGWLQDWGIRKGYTPTLVRKAAMAVGFGLAAAAVPACAVSGPGLYLAFLLIAGIGCGLTGPGLYTFPQTLAGPQAVGKWYGTQNGLANFAGIIGPSLTGFVLDYTKSFLAPFLITAVVCVAGVLAWVYLVGRVEPVQWSARNGRSVAVADASLSS